VQVRGHEVTQDARIEVKHQRAVGPTRVVAGGNQRGRDDVAGRRALALSPNRWSALRADDRRAASTMASSSSSTDLGSGRPARCRQSLR